MGSNQRNSGSITSHEFNFWAIFKRYSADQEIFSVKLIVVSAFTTSMTLYIIKVGNKVPDSIKYVFNLVISASTDIFAIIIASFGLFAAITDINFATTIYKLGQLENLLFPFWFCAILWVANLLYSLVANLIMDSQLFGSAQVLLIFSFGFFLFCISLLYTVELIGDILKLTIYRTKLQILEDDHQTAGLVMELPVVNPNYQRFLRIFVFIIAIVMLGHWAWGYSLFTPKPLLVYIFGALDFALLYVGFKLYWKLIDKRDKTLMKLRLVVKLVIILNLIYFSLIISNG